MGTGHQQRACGGWKCGAVAKQRSRQDSNLQPLDPKSNALPLSHATGGIERCAAIACRRQQRVQLGAQQACYFLKHSCFATAKPRACAGLPARAHIQTRTLRNRPFECCGNMRAAAAPTRAPFSSPMAQSVARQAVNLQVAGSNPAGGEFAHTLFACVATVV